MWIACLCFLVVFFHSVFRFFPSVVNYFTSFIFLYFFHVCASQTTLSDDDSKDNKNEVKGIELKVNLNDMDCKTKEVTINNVDDRSWDKVLKTVGEACQDLQWTSKYSLCTTAHTNGIEKFVDTSQDFSQFLQENGGKGVTLFAKVT